MQRRWAARSTKPTKRSSRKTLHSSSRSSHSHRTSSRALHLKAFLRAFRTKAPSRSVSKTTPRQSKRLLKTTSSRRANSQVILKKWRPLRTPSSLRLRLQIKARIHPLLHPNKRHRSTKPINEAKIKIPLPKQRARIKKLCKSPRRTFNHKSRPTSRLTPQSSPCHFSSPAKMSRILPTSSWQLPIKKTSQTSALYQLHLLRCSRSSQTRELSAATLLTIHKWLSSCNRNRMCSSSVSLRAPRTSTSRMSN